MKKYKHGVIAGKFRLLHKGHKQALIHATLHDLEVLHVIIIETPDIKRYSSIEELKQSISEILRKFHMPYQIHIVHENITNSIEWDQLVIDTVHADKDEIVIFNSKDMYENFIIDNYFLKTYTSGISVCELEENPYRFENYLQIAPEFARYINKKYVISGVESSGKTEMCKKLADIYDTEYSKEVGRFYADDYLAESPSYEPFYHPRDFVGIVFKQLSQDKTVNISAKRMLLLDTDPIVTIRFLHFYRNYYIDVGRWSNEYEEEFKRADSLISEICTTYKVDQVFLLEPAVFHADTKRIVIDEERRMQEFNDLKKWYDKFNIPYIVIPFGNDYESRFHQVCSYINTDLHIEKDSNS